ncbi:MAG TPA: cytochrome b N-terminal domain-containing protein [Haliangiales bacterium]|nr:cytochrome b N-terminal domain-containing protein [Haliangiales bacterium]
MSAPERRRGRLFRWLDSRYQLQPVVDFLEHKEVPVGVHSLIWYYLGGTTLFFFVVQIASGVLLLMYYQPGEATAYESIRYITTKVPFGWLIRSVHCWSAHLMIVSLVAHMFSTLMLKAYRPPRELTWVTGFLLFAVALGFGFSGYLLPWNELSFFATSVGTDSVKEIPVIGDWLLQVLRGGTEVSINTLYRFFGLHVVILPLAAFAIIAVHLLFIQRQGMAPPVHPPATPRAMKFFPNFAVRDLLIWLLCLAALTSLAVFLPYGPGVPGVEWELGKKANPLAPAYPGIKPEWYFLWVYQLLKEFPPHLVGGLEGPQAALLLVGGLLVVWALIPWLDRSARRNEPSPAFTDFGMAALLFIAFLTLKAWDIGGGAGKVPDARAVAWTTAWYALGVALVSVVVRAVVYRHRWFLFTGAFAVHVVLHGLVGLPYLLAGAIGIGVLLAALGGLKLRGRGAVALLVVLGAVSAARADEPLPPALQKMFDARRPDGAPVIPPAQREYFAKLPDRVRALVAEAADATILGSAEHARRLFALNLPPTAFELLIKDNCIVCHTDPGNVEARTLFSADPKADKSSPRLNLKEFASDVHFRRGVSCSGCHGGSPTDLNMTDAIAERWPSEEDRAKSHAWIPAFCARCHSDAAYMRSFNQALPTDQLAKYKTSRHGQRLLVEGDDKAAQCASCHGGHGIRSAKSPKSMVHPQRVPETCGACHADARYMAGEKTDRGEPLPTNQLEQYRKSAHGKALLEKGDLGAPACNSCHGNHAAQPPAVASVSEVCRVCHVTNGRLFDGSKHKIAFEKHGWPECAQCHGKHDIAKANDELLADGAERLCHACHAKDAPDNKECDATASHFHATLGELAGSMTAYTVEGEELAKKGLDVEPLTNVLGELEESLVKAREGIHSFDKDTFDRLADPARAAAKKSQELIDASRKEYRFRQGGLLAAIGAMSLLALGIYLTLRRIESRKP